MEIWKDITGYKGIYQISNHGRLRRIWKKSRRNPEGKLKILNCSLSNDGYCKADLWKNKKRKTYRIHRLVSFEFIENPLNKPQVNHIDGNKINNHVDNLEWCTCSENIKHAYKTGLKKFTGKIYGEKNGSSKLTQKQVDQIKELKGLKKQKEIAKMFNVSPRTISDIYTGRTWSKKSLVKLNQ